MGRAAVAVAIVLLLAFIGLIVRARRRRTSRLRRLAELRAEGRLPGDVEGALRRASRGNHRAG